MPETINATFIADARIRDEIFEVAKPHLLQFADRQLAAHLDCKLVQFHAKDRDRVLAYRP